jgi:hypothetical protein
MHTRAAARVADPRRRVDGPILTRGAVFERRPILTRGAGSDPR